MVQIKKDRRRFIKSSIMGGAAISLPLINPNRLEVINSNNKINKIGIIGLDTSHSEVFTRLINEDKINKKFRVIAAYPHGSEDIPSALQMKPNITKAVQELGVKIVDSIDELIENVDFVLLESNDGRVHYEQALPVLQAGKIMFIDKPLAHNLEDAKKIYEMSEKYNTPIFSSSALRYEKSVQEVLSGKFGKILGVDVYTPAGIEESHIDMAWYGIHGVEMLFTLLGKGCQKVIRTHTKDTDVVTGVWNDERIGNLRGIRAGAADIAGIAFCESKIVPIGPFSGYLPLVKEILQFFDSGIPPVEKDDTIEIFKFMHAADQSKLSGKYCSLIQ